MKWKLANEICEIAGCEDLNQALFHLNLIDTVKSKFEIDVLQDWIRGGSETYILRFAISQESGERSEYLMKACTALSFGLTIQSIVESWIEKRQIISSHGVSTPRLIGVGKGLIIEDFIPFTLVSVLRDPKLRHSHLVQLASYAGIIHVLGFQAIDPFSDLRSDGSRLYAIDFGEDIGSCANRPIYSYHVLLDALISTLNSWNIDLHSYDLHLVRTVYYEITSQ